MLPLRLHPLYTVRTVRKGGLVFSSSTEENKQNNTISSLERHSYPRQIMMKLFVLLSINRNAEVLHFSCTCPHNHA